MTCLPKKGVFGKIAERNERVRHQKEQAFVQSRIELQFFLSLMVVRVGLLLFDTLQKYL
jgi:hypothetical protein